MKSLSAKNLEVISTTKGALPRVPFVELYKEIFNPSYQLSISFVSSVKMKTLSVAYKGDPSHMNVLSFPLSKNSGEIIICLSAAKREAPKFDRGCHQHVKFLVIHGMLHLAGHTHSSKMESEEKRLMKKVGF